MKNCGQPIVPFVSFDFYVSGMIDPRKFNFCSDMAFGGVNLPWSERQIHRCGIVDLDNAWITRIEYCCSKLSCPECKCSCPRAGMVSH